MKAAMRTDADFRNAICLPELARYPERVNEFSAPAGINLMCVAMCFLGRWVVFLVD